MDYELDTPATSDMISCGRLLLGGQQFSDFRFTWTGNFRQGTYDLIAAGSPPVGSLGSSLSGTIDGLPATLAVQNNDLVLNVTPEPSTLALLAAGVIGLAGYVWRRKCAARRTARPAAFDPQDAPAILSPSHSTPASAARRAA